MKLVFVCGLIVVLAQYSSAGQICDYAVDYTTAFLPSCTGNEATMKWPYYQDFTKFYECVNGKPILLNCPAGTQFNYFKQKCVGCSEFIPAPECKYLRTINKPQCIPLATTTSSTTTPKPIARPTLRPNPSTTSTSATTTTKTTKKPETVPTPGSGGGIPTPPLIPTPAPGVPTPPVEPPTPPTVEESPPIQP